MPRLIDAEKLEPSEMYTGDGFTRIVYMDDIDEMPTVDAEPVVRCKDCLEFKYCLHNEYNDPNGFCAWGERREDGNNDRN